MKRVFAILLAVLCLCAALPLASCGGSTPTEGLAYTEIEGGTAYEVSGIGTATDLDIVIPDTYNGKPVTSIGKNAFSAKSNLRSIKLPDSITNIGLGALTDCTGAFETKNGVSYIGKWAVACDPQATEVTLREDTVGIAAGAFMDAAFTAITIPESVCYIGEEAFAGAALVAITIPAGVKSIGAGSVSSCKDMTSITVAQGNTSYHSSGNCLIETASGTLISGCDTSVIPTDGSVKIIGKEAFSFVSPVDLVIPASVTEIGERAFYGAGGFSTLDLTQSGVVTIGKEAFGNCLQLTEVRLPVTLKTIGAQAFSFCHNLTSLTISEGTEQIGTDAFYYCSSLPAVYIPASVTAIGSGAFNHCDALTAAEFAVCTGWTWNDGRAHELNDFTADLAENAEVLTGVLCNYPWQRVAE